ncbi:NAD(P)/FAD-dependent oxidoreductase [Nitrospirillum sp. BR 11828]|uniref:NAD(P)/FAD-dependent oxidoreductase n=1 Tax=Nitrospirillum sp. BR 11828 TaxID=3104325 RepID=UPI002ACA1C7B|nr:NAD(P)/FAD-dependent oxidoreductase [Nitrospirillum sp. BR 11828]MDZ5650672.1 NAD(P)/FAD-dependent oxidoreductase [Nitrospirillum sp. BR 11828]
MAKLAVIGAGAMGLAAAYYALKAGHEVAVYEVDTQPGGMAAHFDFGGLSIERYYHFICKSDQPTFDLLAELGIADTLKWRTTSMGYFIDGKHYRWGDPLALLSFPLLGLIDKLRLGLQMFLTTKARDFQSIEHLDAATWFKRGAGEKPFNVLWKRLLDLKFFEYADNVSASWIATRIRRIGNSRQSLMKEQLGYLEGGSETLVQALAADITRRGGALHLGAKVEEIVAEGGRVTAVRTAQGVFPADAVICTVPTPYVAGLVPAFTQSTKDKYDAIKNIGVVCVMLKLKRPVTRHFWLNVNDPTMEIPGIIEFSNLRPLPDTVVYIPYYMPHSHPKWGWTDADFVAETMACMRRLNPAITDADLIDTHVGRLRYAQPVCEPDFLDKLPPVKTEIAGLQVADTCYYYPEDRGIAESIRFAKRMVDAL